MQFSHACIYILFIFIFPQIKRKHWTKRSSSASSPICVYLFGSLQHKMFISSYLFLLFMRVINSHPTQLYYLRHTWHEPSTFYQLICIPHCTSSQMTPHTLPQPLPSFHSLWEREKEIESNNMRQAQIFLC